VKCVHKEFEDVYTMAACRTRKSGVLSAQDCGSATDEKGERDPIRIETPEDLNIRVEQRTAAPTVKDHVPESEVGWDCDYTVGSPTVLRIKNSCESKDCHTKPDNKSLVVGGVQCLKTGFASRYTVIICNNDQEKTIPSANQCRIKFHKENKNVPAKKITLRSGLPILATGNSDGLLSDGTAATTHKK